MTCEYGINFIEDADLPPGRDWVFVRVDGDTHLFIKRNRVCPQVLEGAWSAYREMAPS